MGNIVDVAHFAVPHLQTKRMLFREFQSNDLDDYHQITSDRECMRYLGGPVDRQTTWRLMALTLGHWALLGYGVWALTDINSNFLGRAGLFNQEGWPGVEVTWTIGRDKWGKGYATEAGRASLAFAFESIGLDRVICLAHPENVASQRVARKIGMSIDSMHELDGEQHFIYAITADSWRKSYAQQA
jgi:RimJ/RimL family protein N-acetyltransferase